LHESRVNILHTMATFYLILFIIGILPIIGYPMILFLNIATLPGCDPKKIPRITMVMMKSYMWSTTLYPIIYFFALYKYRNTPQSEHFVWAGIILLYLLFIFVMFKGWTITERKHLKRGKQI